mmetsp:Transcript_55080/g.159951  ORF Transcript_55080/g.159951 Transcript_55080/m.159951 type:complete len:199 (+) Transcript_55080:126-722(+)
MAKLIVMLVCLFATLAQGSWLKAAADTVGQLLGSQAVVSTAETSGSTGDKSVRMAEGAMEDVGEAKEGEEVEFAEVGEVALPDDDEVEEEEHEGEEDDASAEMEEEEGHDEEEVAGDDEREEGDVAALAEVGDATFPEYEEGEEAGEDEGAEGDDGAEVQEAEESEDDEEIMDREEGEESGEAEFAQIGEVAAPSQSE